MWYSFCLCSWMRGSLWVSYGAIESAPCDKLTFYNYPINISIIKSFCKGFLFALCDWNYTVGCKTGFTLKLFCQNLRLILRTPQAKAILDIVYSLASGMTIDGSCDAIHRDIEACFVIVIFYLFALPITEWGSNCTLLIAQLLRRGL